MTTWNGVDQLSPAGVLELSRPEAARWFFQDCDPGGLVETTADVDVIVASCLRAHASDERDAWLPAYRYAVACAVERVRNDWGERPSWAATVLRAVVLKAHLTKKTS